MAKHNINSKKGFTIIEVVLVLAIAGLIFLMVFIAWPALQRSQRDTQRRDDMSRFLSQLAQYQTNNGGSTPAPNKEAYNAFVADYLTLNGKDQFKDPTSNETYYVGSVIDCWNQTCTPKSDEADAGWGWIRLYYNATCDGEKPTKKYGKNSIAITIKLEGSGVYCGHN